MGARVARPSILSLAALTAPILAPRAAIQADYAGDVRYAIEEIEARCDELIRSKGIAWREATASFLSEASAVRDSSAHLVLLTRLLARLRDGTASVQLLPAAGDARWPEEGRTSPAMTWCRIDGSVYLRNVRREADRLGLEPGMEVLAVDGVPVADWLEQRMGVIRDRFGFSSEQHAHAFLLHEGLQDATGLKRTLVVKKARGGKSEREVLYRSSNPLPGPAHPPEDLAGTTEGAGVRWGLTAKKLAYVNVRGDPQDLLEQLDQALAALGSAPGLILDLRGHASAPIDPAAFLGRFVPAGKTYAALGEWASAGPAPYGGPVVAIVDGTVLAGGEMAAALIRYEGRGYVIGESASAGSCARGIVITLPSGLFALSVSTASEMPSYNDGKGLEGIGVLPHRLVPFAEKDLEKRIDTQIAEAERILARFPAKEVRYDPADFGWKK